MSPENKHKLLFVEDNLDLLEMLGAYFQVQGYEVITAANGEDALGRIAENVPDMAVLDINLPGIDGYELCRRMREQRRTKHTPVIFLTEKREREDRLAGLELEAVDFITKPFDVQELRLRIRNTLRRIDTGKMRNPVTGLAEGTLAEERLRHMMEQPDWGIVYAGIRGLRSFRDAYGFVAADDVIRAVTLMLANAVQEAGGEEEAIVHVAGGDFVVFTAADRSHHLAVRCLARLRPAIQYFYPAVDRQRLHQMQQSDRLAVRVASLSAGEFEGADVEAMLTALKNRAR